MEHQEDIEIAEHPRRAELFTPEATGFVADLVRTERAAGRAAEGPDALALATMLLELNDRALERLVQGDLPRTDLVETIVAIWLRTLFSPTPATTAEEQR